MAPEENPNECSRAAILANLLRRPTQGQPVRRQPRRLLRDQGYPLRHPDRLSTMNTNSGNDGQIRHGMSDDQLRAHPDQQGGGISEARRCRRLEAQADNIQPAQVVPHNSEKVQHEQTYMEGNEVTAEWMQMPEQIHLTPTASQYQAVTIEQMQMPKKIHLMPRASQHRVDVDLDQMKQAQKEEARRLKNLEIHNEANQQQTILDQQNQATRFRQQQQQLIARVIPGSMTWLSEQQRQQQFPGGHAPNLLSGEGSRLVMSYSAVTGHMVVSYANTVNVFDNVSLELAKAVCKMLARKETPPHMSAPSSAQAQASPTGEPFLATNLSLTQVLEEKKGRVNNKEEEDIDAAIVESPQSKAIVCNTIDQPGPSSALGTCHGSTMASPATQPVNNSSNLKRKTTYDCDANMEIGDTYMRGASGEYILVDDVNYPLTATLNYVKREYDARLKDSDK